MGGGIRTRGRRLWTGAIIQRRVVQFGFLALTMLGVFAFKGNAEAWCPFGGVEAFYTYITEGDLTCSLAFSNLYVLAGVLVMTLLLRRAFCAYVCPIGTLSEWLQRGAAGLGVRTTAPPRGLDQALSLLKYPLLGVILYFTYKTAELVFRGFDPCYVLISRHGEDITFWAYVVAGAIAAGSLVLVIPFCRWLCPFAAVLNAFSRFGLARISRDQEACVNCGKCAAACPMAIPVDRVRQVTEARCLSCLNCVDSCPVAEGGAVSWGPPRWFGRRWSVRTLITIVLLCTATAVAANFLFPMPSFTRARGQRPAETRTVRLRVEGLSCRGNANLLMYYLERDDAYAITGYVELVAWPGIGFARAHVICSASTCDEAAVNRAITEPYYDPVGAIWRFSPFRIEGYDPLDADEAQPGRQ